jgi:hypothetical protein
MRVLVAIDDTDNAESRGTGFRARTLGARLESAELAALRGVTRHQLLVHPDIPYTSHNSALCLDATIDAERRTALEDFCREFVRAESAPGSDAGLCVAEWDRIDDALVDWGKRAQNTVLDLESAMDLAAATSGVLLEGLTGERIGAIGALAAVGLRRTDDDGRFVWLRGVRELSGIHEAGSLLRETGIEEIRSRDGQRPEPEERIRVDPWPRALLVGGRALLLVDRSTDSESHEWQLVGREVIRQH